jgi:hypothetical protein
MNHALLLAGQRLACLAGGTECIQVLREFHTYDADPVFKEGKPPVGARDFFYGTDRGGIFTKRGRSTTEDVCVWRTRYEIIGLSKSIFSILWQKKHIFELCCTSCFRWLGGE